MGGIANGPGFANDWLTGWTDAKGPAQLTLESLTMPGTQVIELKHVKLNLRSSL